MAELLLENVCKYSSLRKKNLLLYIISNLYKFYCIVSIWDTAHYRFGFVVSTRFCLHDVLRVEWTVVLFEIYFVKKYDHT